MDKAQSEYSYYSDDDHHAENPKTGSPARVQKTKSGMTE